MISQHEYHQRRCRLAQALPANSLAIIPAADEVLRNGDAHYRFRQDSHFYYLTGFQEPEALLVIMAGEEGDSLLFNRPRNAAMEQWTGRRLGQDNAGKVLGVKQAFSITELSERLPQLLAGKNAVYYTLERNPHYDAFILGAIDSLKKQIRRGVQAPEAIVDVDPHISELRLFKSEAEINLMRKAADISVAAHKKAMQKCRQLAYEYELEAELIHEFFRQGCRSVAYDPIVGGGENACILHYTDNNQPLKQADLVLIDAGGEYQNYAADITRTFPVSGKFSPEQRAIYELVLKAQKAGVACIRPGLRWVEVQQTMVKIMTAGLIELGLLHGSLEELIQKEAYKSFYMHNSGHWLGLDVHDCGAYKLNNDWRLLEPGMVLTVEPGLYISANTPGVDEKWWNIGVRIEDDVLVTATGHENLTAALPVEVDEIERLMQS
ncbi:proline aminopeptidase P II [Legionella birminghamensis]|uniref:Xaa-Pro aminopeptidase n=1 Tax=Legionella birminghamensis TaxID=28083 RepID=A0A378IEM8_9GAMM|nr:Xaa-Pro aminopeptidase [Legionella birminghamensis]KTC68846.1 proline aminopeptidase P II [Legionella birminghamensis]STX33212.1 proline aminopeptidase P II [Legionella birminghamensis]